MLDARPRRPTNRKGTKRIKRRRSYSERKRSAPIFDNCHEEAKLAELPKSHGYIHFRTKIATPLQSLNTVRLKILKLKMSEQLNSITLQKKVRFRSVDTNIVDYSAWPDSQPCSYCNESSPSSKTDYDCQHKSCDSCTTTLRNASECARCTSDSKLSRQSVLVGKVFTITL